MPYLTKKSDPKNGRGKVVQYLDDDDSSKWNEHVAWKLDVGTECNLLLELAKEIDERPAIGPNKSYAATLRSIVARVAHFEELETE